MEENQNKDNNSSSETQSENLESGKKSKNHISTAVGTIVLLALLGAVIWGVVYFMEDGDRQIAERYSLPSVSVAYGGEIYEGQTGGPYCWQHSIDGEEICVSYLFDPESAEEVIEIIRGDEIDISIESKTEPMEIKAVIKEFESREIVEEYGLDTLEDRISPGVSEGMYILRIEGSWEQGDYTRSFVVDIKDVLET